MEKSKQINLVWNIMARHQMYGMDESTENK